MEILLSQNCTTYFWHQIYATRYFYYYVNEFGTYLFISQTVLNGVIGSQRENVVILPHRAQRKHAFFGEINQISKTKKLSSR